jgi:hypothetical protein
MFLVDVASTRLTKMKSQVSAELPFRKRKTTILLPEKSFLSA